MHAIATECFAFALASQQPFSKPLYNQRVRLKEGLCSCAKGSSDFDADNGSNQSKEDKQKVDWDQAWSTYQHKKKKPFWSVEVLLWSVGLPTIDGLILEMHVSGRDDEATKLRAFSLVLREGAKAWYQTLAPEERRDWETLKTAFIEEFRHQEPPEEIWRQLLELRQTSPNDYRSYKGKFSNLWEKWCASVGEGERAPECLKKDCFLAELYPILREKVKVKFPDTFEKAMAYAREKDRKLKFQAQLQGGMEPPPPTQPIARAVAGTSATDQESSQQELLQQITNQLES
ncbi:hypothetical protein L7F22_007385 [Adiantum nelumboides]|nr:hypothetical protein [Adiantum nelumboides]